jgi:hypothetical protein
MKSFQEHRNRAPVGAQEGHVRRGRVGALAGMAVVVLLLQGGSSSAQGPVTWSGEWRTDYGQMTLTQSGSSVEGNYTHDQGHLTGSVNGNVLSGTWDEAPTRAAPYDTGDFQFTLQADLKSFRGTWKNVGETDWRGGWSGTCVSGQCLQNGAAPQVPTPAPRPPLEPDRPARNRLRVAFDNRRFEPATATVASGARIRICNESNVVTKVFSYSSAGRHTTLEPVPGERRGRTEYRLPGPGRTSLRPGQCDHFTVRNPTGAPLRLALFDELHSSARLVLTIQPAP